MNKKQITVTIIALLFFVGIFMGSQEYVGGTTRINVGILVGGWITTGVVWLGLVAMMKSKPRV
jgi:hypothetical protein